jgi:hypothetical protein
MDRRAMNKKVVIEMGGDAYIVITKRFIML